MYEPGTRVEVRPPHFYECPFGTVIHVTLEDVVRVQMDGGKYARNFKIEDLMLVPTKENMFDEWE